jgi:glycine amidinotransferase
MINSNTSFGKLKEVVVGRELQLTTRYTDLTFRQFFREALDEKIYEQPFDSYQVSLDLINQRNADLDGLASVLEGLDVTVHRPDPLTKITPFSTPHFKSEMSSASNVRDITWVYGNSIIETPTFVRNRYYENMLLYNVYNRAFDKGRGGKWIRCPHTELTEHTVDLEHWGDSRDYTNIPDNYVMAIDGAQFLRIGRDVIVNINSYNQYLGFEWVKSFFPLSDFHVLHVADNHIDGCLMCLRPGVFLVNPGYPNIKHLLPKKFHNWEFIYPEHVTPNINVAGMTSIDLRLASSRGLDINVLSVNENTVVVNKRATGVIEALESHGFDVVQVVLDNGEIFAGGIHCSTLDLVRDDEYIRYTN